MKGMGWDMLKQLICASNPDEMPVNNASQVRTA